MRDIMKLNLKHSAVAEWLIIAAVLFAKTALTQPLYEQLFWLSGSYYISKATLMAAIAAAILAVVFTFMLKSTGKLGDWTKIITVLIVAEPMLISNSVSLFNVLSVLLAVIWVTVCIKVENRIVAAAVSVVATAAMSFLMPCSVFSLIPLGILVLLITTKSDTFSVVFSAVGSIVSVIAAVVNVQLSDEQVRAHLGLYQVFGEYGGNECHPLSLVRLTENTGIIDLSTQFSRVLFASYPVVIFAACIVYGIIRYDGAEEIKKAGRKAPVYKKIITVALIIVPYVLSAIGSTLCSGIGALAAFNFAPLAIILALASAGNKAVISSLEKVSGFAKAHPVVSVISIVWIASYTMAFASSAEIFSFATQFFM